MSPRRPEIAARWLVDCKDTHGNQIKVGAGTTSTGDVVPICPSGHQPVLNIQQAYDVIDAFRQAAQDAATRDG